LKEPATACDFNSTMTPTDILQPSDFEGSKILIVDDERINNVIMRRILEAEKFLVT